MDKKRDMIGALQFWKRAMNERYVSTDRLLIRVLFILNLPTNLLGDVRAQSTNL